MKYELAKKLKDAGFPQKSFSPYYLEKGAPSLEEHNKQVSKKGMGGVPWTIAVPTLSELIKICGEDFAWLHRKADGKYLWVASTFYDDREGVNGIGITPEEAVANLWLVLNKK